jgi:hypothetical protein
VQAMHVGRRKVVRVDIKGSVCELKTRRSFLVKTIGDVQVARMLDVTC